MKHGSNIWQGHVSYWQNLFIRQNLMMIGYIAWSGYLYAGRGLVVCQVVDTLGPFIDWNTDLIAFTPAFIPQVQVARYLQSLELEEDAASTLLRAIATYNPTEAIVTLVMGNAEADFSLLQQLKIPPADCYQQVQRRWAEFQPGLVFQRRFA